jgi:hypothetical protein
MPPISLSDEELATVKTIATPIAPRLRARFLEHVATELGRQPVMGPAVVYRVCTDLQRHYLNGSIDKRPAAKFRRRAD